MDENEVVSVRVVSTQPDYPAQIKNAAVASVVTVIVTTITMSAMAALTKRVSNRSNKTAEPTVEPK